MDLEMNDRKAVALALMIFFIITALAMLFINDAEINRINQDQINRINKVLEHKKDSSYY